MGDIENMQNSSSEDEDNNDKVLKKISSKNKKNKVGRTSQWRDELVWDDYGMADC